MIKHTNNTITLNKQESDAIYIVEECVKQIVDNSNSNTLVYDNDEFELDDILENIYQMLKKIYKIY